MKCAVCGSKEGTEVRERMDGTKIRLCLKHWQMYLASIHEEEGPQGWA